MRVFGSGFRVWDLGFGNRVWGLGFGVWGSEIWVKSYEIAGLSSGIMVYDWGSKIGDWES